MANYQEIFKDKKDFEAQYRAACQSELGKTFDQCSELEQFQVLARLIASKGNAQLPVSHSKDEKKVYYFSLEFLIGPLLDNYLINYDLGNVIDIPLTYYKDLILYNTDKIAGYEFSDVPAFFDVSGLQPVA